MTTSYTEHPETILDSFTSPPVTKSRIRSTSSIRGSLTQNIQLQDSLEFREVMKSTKAMFTKTIPKQLQVNVEITLGPKCDLIFEDKGTEMKTMDAVYLANLFVSYYHPCAWYTQMSKSADNSYGIYLVLSAMAMANVFSAMLFKYPLETKVIISKIFMNICKVGKKKTVASRTTYFLKGDYVLNHYQRIQEQCHVVVTS